MKPTTLRRVTQAAEDCQVKLFCSACRHALPAKNKFHGARLVGQRCWACKRGQIVDVEFAKDITLRCPSCALEERTLLLSFTGSMCPRCGLDFMQCKSVAEFDVENPPPVQTGWLSPVQLARRSRPQPVQRARPAGPDEFPF